MITKKSQKKLLCKNTEHQNYESLGLANSQKQIRFHFVMIKFVSLQQMKI